MTTFDFSSGREGFQTYISDPKGRLHPTPLTKEQLAMVFPIVRGIQLIPAFEITSSFTVDIKSNGDVASLHLDASHEDIKKVCDILSAPSAAVLDIIKLLEEFETYCAESTVYIYREDVEFEAIRNRAKQLVEVLKR